jgi:hypothetical protein
MSIDISIKVWETLANNYGDDNDLLAALGLPVQCVKMKISIKRLLLFFPEAGNGNVRFNAGCNFTAMQPLI